MVELTRKIGEVSTAWDFSWFSDSGGAHHIPINQVAHGCFHVFRGWHEKHSKILLKLELATNIRRMISLKL